MNRVSSDGLNPWYVSIDEKNRNVVAANYGNGTLSIIPLNEDGSLKGDIQIIQEESSSINELRMCDLLKI